MSLCSEYERVGSWLFRHRSFLPLAAFPVIVSGITTYHYVCKSHALTEWVQDVGLMVALLGMAFRVGTIGYVPFGTSGRNTKSQAAYVLNTTGMYSIVRHPLYFGNYLVVLGLTMGLHSWISLILISGIFYLFYERIMFAEEGFLREKFDGQFEAWADRTPAFLPRLSGWIKPEMRFCWRTVLRREYTGLVMITTLFFLIDLVGDSIAERHLKLDPKWIAVFAVGMVLYLTLRSLKKYTRFLHVFGR